MAGSIDTSPSAVATNALATMPLGQIIGGPLNACVQAQAQAALTSYNFIKEVGLTADADGTNAKAVYVTFEYRRQGKLTQVSVPLLTIVPIPYLAIRDINIAFKANISASSSSSVTEQESFSWGASMGARGTFFFGAGVASVNLNASVSSKKDSTATRDSKYSVEYTMDVSVSAGQDDMPAGMAKVLELLNESVDTFQKGGELVASETYLKLNDQGVATTYISFKDNDGLYAPQGIELFRKNGTSESKIQTSDTKVTRLIGDNGLNVTFTEAGIYMAKGGERALVIVVE